MTRTTNPKSIMSAFGRAAALALVVGGVAGCTQGADEAATGEADLAEGSGPAKIVGMPWLHGADPRQERPTTSVAFSPRYYTVVYIRFEDGAHLVARHAYFPVVQGQADRVGCALDYLKAYNGGAEATDPRCRPYTHATGRPRPVSEDFDDFEFGSQQRVYVLVDNPGVAFNPTTPISFTPFNASERPTEFSDKPPREPNASFYNARVGTLGDSGRVGLLFDNYYRGKGARPLPEGYEGDDSVKYSVNFNLLVCRGGRQSCDVNEPAQVIPLAIDPDTGNGWGSKP